MELQGEHWLPWPHPGQDPGPGRAQTREPSGWEAKLLCCDKAVPFLRNPGSSKMDIKAIVSRGRGWGIKHQNLTVSITKVFFQ